MNLLSQTTGYAIEALACLAKSGMASKMVREVAEETGISQAYLAKVVQRLVVGGIVESKRGYRGGIKLARSADEITVQDIDDAVEGSRPPDRCLLGMIACSDERACPAHTFWKKTRADIRDRLSQLTLAEIVEFEEKRDKNEKNKGLVDGLSAAASGPSGPRASLD